MLLLVVKDVGEPVIITCCVKKQVILPRGQPHTAPAQLLPTTRQKPDNLNASCPCVSCRRLTGAWMTKDALSASLGNLEANYPSSSTPTPTFHTPPSSTDSSSRPRSRKTSPFKPDHTLSNQAGSGTGGHKLQDWRGKDHGDKVVGLDEEDEDMNDKDGRSFPHRHPDGHSAAPLLKDEGGGRSSYDGPIRPPFRARKSTLRSRSPDLEGSKATRKKYTYAAFFLGISLVSFVIQTETAVYIQDELKWKKAYCMLYVY